MQSYTLYMKSLNLLKMQVTCSSQCNINGKSIYDKKINSFIDK